LNNISYHCHNHKDVEKIQKMFIEQGYTFNDNVYKHTYPLNPTQEWDGVYKTILHIKHDIKDMSYDYYSLKYPPQKLDMISKNKIIVDCNVLFREDKLKRILNNM